jgi:hypothetical protein
MSQSPHTSNNHVTLYRDLDNKSTAENLASRYKIKLIEVTTATIPGSFWDAPEAGLIGHKLYLREDTPVHSFLHELCHYICMSPDRRKALHTDAGGRQPVEENAVCYLQLLLADQLSGYSQQKAFRDMDLWGYSFRLGSAEAWFREDAEDAIEFLQKYFLIDCNNLPTFQVNLDKSYLP